MNWWVLLRMRMNVPDSYKFTIERGGMGEISNEGSLGKVRILLGCGEMWGLLVLIKSIKGKRDSFIFIIFVNWA